MTIFKSPLFFIGAALFLIAGHFHALAAGESLQITDVLPVGVVNASTTVSFTVSPSGFTSPKYSVSDSFSASGATVGAIDKFGYFTWTPKIYDAGTHTITVSATDDYGHSASNAVNIFVSSNAIAIINLSPGPIVAAFRPVTFTVVAPGFISPSFNIYESYSRSTLSTRNIDSSGSFSWTPTYDDLGTHAITIAATDIYGHNARIVENITVINPIVFIQSLKPGSAAKVGSPISFQANAATLANPAFSVSDFFSGTSTVAATAINSAGAFAWTPSISDIGTHFLTVSATDTYGNIASTTATISVTAAPAAAATPVSPPVLPQTNAPAVSSSTATAAKSYFFAAYLAIGSRGTAVLELQKRLTALGFYSGPLTGYFGSLTSASIKQLQSAHGLSRVGVVGPATRAVLNKN